MNEYYATVMAYLAGAFLVWVGAKVKNEMCMFAGVAVIGVTAGAC